MSEKVWLITSAGSGIRFEITKAALAAGKKVVATGRDTTKVNRSGQLSSALAYEQTAAGLISVLLEFS